MPPVPGLSGRLWRRYRALASLMASSSQGCSLTYWPSVRGSRSYPPRVPTPAMALGLGDDAKARYLQTGLSNHGQDDQRASVDISSSRARCWIPQGGARRLDRAITGPVRWLSNVLEGAIIWAVLAGSRGRHQGSGMHHSGGRRMSKPDIPPRRVAPAVVRYGLSVFSVALSLAATSLLQPYVFRTPLFFLSIMVNTWVGGTGPGLLAVLLSTVSVSVVLNPQGAVATRFHDVPYLAGPFSFQKGVANQA